MKKKNDDNGLIARVEALANLVKALQQREDAVAISNEALKLNIESMQIEHTALLREIESLKKIDEALKAGNEELNRRIEALKADVEVLKASDEARRSRREAIKSSDEALKPDDGALKRRNEAIKTGNDALRSSAGAIKQNEEANKGSEEAKRLRNEQLSKSEEFAGFVKAKANEVKKIRVNGKVVTARLVRVFLEIADKGSVHIFEVRKNLDIPRSTMDHTLAILRKMNWVYLRGGQKFGAYTLTEEGKSVIEKFGVSPPAAKELNS